MSLVSCSSTKSSPSRTKIQVGLLNSGISVRECNVLTQELELDEQACELVVKDYEPFLNRARMIVSKLPLEIRKTANIEKLSIILKEFPSTTDDEILKAYESKDKEKSDDTKIAERVSTEFDQSFESGDITAAELLKKRRKKLKERNMVGDFYQSNAPSNKNEKPLSKKLQKAFDKSIENIEEEKLSPSELLKRRREKLEERKVIYPNYKNPDYEKRQNELLDKKLGNKFTTDDCNASPHSTSCTQGPNSADYSNYPSVPRKVEPVAEPVAPMPIEPSSD